MGRIRRHTFTLVPWPWSGMSWVRVPDGLEFTLYRVGDSAIGRGVAVASRPDEEHRWRWAHDAFEAELHRAQEEVRYEHGVRTKSAFMADNVTVRMRRYDLVPGRKARSRRAFERCEARMRAAEATYRPVREEIEARLAQAAAQPD